jgi:5'-deoxynucleotidase
VLRWNIVRTARTQTLAEHLYRTWLLTKELCKHLNLDQSATAICERWALMHDYPEILIGDLPTPTKRAIEQRTGNPDIWKKLERDVCDVIQAKPGTVEAYVVKIADCIEGWYFLVEEGMGEHADDTRFTLMSRAHEVAQEAGAEYPLLPFVDATNRVMVDLRKLPVEHAQ